MAEEYDFTKINSKLDEIRNTEEMNRYLRMMKIRVALIDHDRNIKNLSIEDLEDNIDNKIEIAEDNKEINDFSKKDEMKLENLNAIKKYYRIFKENEERITRYEKAQRDLRLELKDLSAELARKKEEVKKCEESLSKFEEMEKNGVKTLEGEKEKAVNALNNAKRELSQIQDKRIQKGNEHKAYEKLWKDLYEGRGLNTPENIIEKRTQNPLSTEEIINQIANDNGNKQGQENAENSNPVIEQEIADNNNPDVERQIEDEKENSSEIDNNPTEILSGLPKEIRKAEAKNANYEIVLNNNGVELTINGEKVPVDEHNIRNMMEIQKKDPKKFMDLIGKYSGFVEKEFKDIEEAKKILTENGVDINKLNEIDPMILACTDKLTRTDRKENASVLLGKYLESYQKGKKLDNLNITYDLKDLSKGARLIQRIFTTKNYFNLGNKQEIAERAAIAKELGIANVEGIYEPSRMDKFFGLFERNNKNVRAIGPGPENPKEEKKGEPEANKEEPENEQENKPNIESERKEAVSSFARQLQELANKKQENAVNKDSVVNGEDTKTQTQGNESGYRGKRTVSQTVINEKKPAGSRYNRDNKRRGKPSVGAQARNEKHKNKVVETVSVNTELAIKNANKKAEQTNGQNEQENSGR